MSAREVIPLFPLGTVLYPGLLLPLNIFEPRYLRLVEDLSGLPEDRRRFGVVATRHGRETGVGAAHQLYDVGCTALIRRVEEQEDGRRHLVTTGAERFRLHEVLAAGAPYLRAEVEWLPEPAGVEGDPAALHGELLAAFRSYLTALGAARQTPVELPEPPADLTVLSYLVAATTIADLAVKQHLLDCPDTAGRVAAELRLLRRETALLHRLPATPAVELTSLPLSPN